MFFLFQSFFNPPPYAKLIRLPFKAIMIICAILYFNKCIFIGLWLKRYHNTEENCTGADLAFQYQGIYNWTREYFYFTVRLSGDAPGEIFNFLFKGFFLQAKPYLALFVPQYITSWLENPKKGCFFS